MPLTDLQIIIAIAKLDGWKYIPHSIGQKEHFVDPNGVWGSELYEEGHKPYLTSRDVIIPIIEKVRKALSNAEQARFEELFATTIGHHDDYYEGWSLMPSSLLDILTKEPKTTLHRSA